MSWANGIPWAIAVVGWAATHLFSEARERRKEYRAQLDKLHEHILKLEHDARAFHCAAEYDEVKASDLVAKISLIERLAMRIPILSIADLFPYIIGMRRAFSLQNFDKSDFQKQSPTSEIVQDINWAAQELEDALERQYRSRYTHKFPYIKLGS